MFETPKPRWDTLAGRVLDGFFKQVASQLPNYHSPLTVLWLCSQANDVCELSSTHSTSQNTA